MKSSNNDYPFFSRQDPDRSFIVNYAPIFAHLDTLAKNIIIEKSKVVEYKKGDIVYKKGDPPDAFYCLITGRVRVFNYGVEKKNTLEYLNCGKYFGMISVLTGEPHSVSAEAVNDSKILRINKEDFKEILDRIPKLAIDLSKTLSRRLRKKDIDEKKIFESSIISIFSAVPEVGRTAYAVNLAHSLKKETGRNVILINVRESKSEVSESLNLLGAHFLTDSAIKAAIPKDQYRDLSFLNLKHESEHSAYFNNLNALLTYLTGEYHFIIVDLPVLKDQCIFQILNQSDSIHIITDYDIYNLQQTRFLISELFQKVNYPQDKIKVITNAGKHGNTREYDKVFRYLDYRVYATLPTVSILSANIVLESPETEYSKAIRRIAREVGDVRVGLALSGGAAFGIAHMGVIKALEKENITVDMVVGSSIGALVGALWAAGLNSKELEKIGMWLNNNKKRVFRLLVDPCFPKLSLAKGRGIRKFLEKYLGNKTFQDVKFPFKIVACNLSKRQEVIYDSGKLLDAVMASIAIPGVFAPVKKEGELIIDGGIVEPVPVGAMVRMGIKKLIAVNVFPSPEDIAHTCEFNKKRADEEKKKCAAKGFFAKIIYSLGARLNKMFFPNIMDVIVNSIQALEYVVAESNCRSADIVLRPIVTGVDWFEFFKSEEMIKKGEEETLKLLPAIKTLISE
ncbi:MAG: patatin-like phospholipase family protein [Candidatus Omnitrophota bacterium]